MILIYLLSILSFQVEVNNHLTDLENRYYLKTADQVIIIGDSVESIGLLLPLPGYYENIELSPHRCRFLTDRIAYRYIEIGSVQRLNIHLVDQIPSPGTFYLCSDLHPDSSIILSREPLNFTHPGQIIQFVLRPGDEYLDYLMEIINTPFILTPRFTPQGFHQVDNCLGSDCASFAIYPHRRQGKKVQYVYPLDIFQYLHPINDELFIPQEEDSLSVFQSAHGDVIEINREQLWPGDVIHFGEQVSVFYEDRGIKGILDSQDLVIQSWFNQPGIFTIYRCGFWGQPIRIYKWKINSE